MSSHLTPRETAIMRLWDTGSSIGAIACAMGMSKGNVNAVVSRFHDDGDDRRHKASMQRGSAYLLRAIQLSGKRHHSLVKMKGLAL